MQLRNLYQLISTALDLLLQSHSNWLVADVSSSHNITQITWSSINVTELTHILFMTCALLDIWRLPMLCLSLSCLNNYVYTNNMLLQ